MNVLKKRILISIIFLAIILILLQAYNRNLSSIQTSNNKQPLRVSVLFSNYNITFLRLVTEEMKKVELENPESIKYTFYDGKGDQNLQNDQLNNILSNKEADLFIIVIVDINQTMNVIDRIKQFNLPVIFTFNADTEAIKSYERSFFVSTDSRQSGILEGNIIVDAWKKNKKYIDKNQDNILNYILLLGTPTSKVSSEREKYSVLTIKNNNIKTQQLGSKFCYWSEKQAKEAISLFLLQFGNNIDVIISVEDDMAIGAVKALQSFGYNLGNKERIIPVVGSDGIPEAIDLIKKGAMTGTVMQNAYEVAKDYYTFGINLINNKNIIADTNCTIDITGKIITIPFEGVFQNLD